MGERDLRHIFWNDRAGRWEDMSTGEEVPDSEIPHALSRRPLYDFLRRSRP